MAFFGSNQVAKNMKNKLILMKRGSQQSFHYPRSIANEEQKKIEIVIQGTGRATQVGHYVEHSQRIMVKESPSVESMMRANRQGREEVPIGVSSLNLLSGRKEGARDGALLGKPKGKGKKGRRGKKAKQQYLATEQDLDLNMDSNFDADSSQQFSAHKQIVLEDPTLSRSASDLNSVKAAAPVAPQPEY